MWCHAAADFGWFISSCSGIGFTRRWNKDFFCTSCTRAQPRPLVAEEVEATSGLTLAMVDLSISETVIVAPERGSQVHQVIFTTKIGKDLRDGDHYNLCLEATAADKFSTKKKGDKGSTKGDITRGKKLAELRRRVTASLPVL